MLYLDNFGKHCFFVIVKYIYIFMFVSVINGNLLFAVYYFAVSQEPQCARFRRVLSVRLLFKPI